MYKNYGWIGSAERIGDEALRGVHGRRAQMLQVRVGFPISKSFVHGLAVGTVTPPSSELCSLSSTYLRGTLFQRKYQYLRMR